MIGYHEFFKPGDLLGFKPGGFYLILNSKLREENISYSPLTYKYSFTCLSLSTFKVDKVYYNSIGQYIDSWSAEPKPLLYREGIKQEIGY